jgi:hypothetical protein
MKMAGNTLLRLLLLPAVLTMLACTASDESHAAKRDSTLIDVLSDIKGLYTWNSGLNRYIYSEKLKIEEILTSRDRDASIKVLVDCLDNLTNTQSLLKGKPVAKGIICYEALSQLFIMSQPPPVAILKRTGLVT